MKATFLYPYNKAIWHGLADHPVPITRVFSLSKNRILAPSNVGDTAPPAPSGGKAGGDVL